jgi:mRNA interferase RelE/StbE
MFKIEYSREAFKSLRSMPRNVASTICGKIEQLAAEPTTRNDNAMKLESRPVEQREQHDCKIGKNSG